LLLFLKDKKMKKNFAINYFNEIKEINNLDDKTAKLLKPYIIDAFNEGAECKEATNSDIHVIDPTKLCFTKTEGKSIFFKIRNNY
jgi:hypothetical protein